MNRRRLAQRAVKRAAVKGAAALRREGVAAEAVRGGIRVRVTRGKRWGDARLRWVAAWLKDLMR